MTGKHIPHGTTGNAKKCTSRKSIEELSDNHCLDILGDSAGDEPNQEKEEGRDIDISSPVKLEDVSRRYLAISEQFLSGQNAPPTKAQGIVVQLLQ